MFCLEVALFWEGRCFDGGGPMMGRTEPGSGPGQRGGLQGRLKEAGDYEAERHSKNGFHLW